MLRLLFVKVRHARDCGCRARTELPNPNDRNGNPRSLGTGASAFGQRCRVRRAEQQGAGVYCPWGLIAYPTLAIRWTTGRPALLRRQLNAAIACSASPVLTGAHALKNESAPTPFRVMGRYR
jgi:hypothetical protein